MKLKIQNWKSAWFDSHINDRFFNEMSRVEKGMVHELGTSAQWMEQVMIDVGQLAQAMIRLESSETPEPQVRHALEKALRLAALSLQLVVTLDGLDRELLKSGQRQYAVPDFSASPMSYVADYSSPLPTAATPPAQAEAPPPAPAAAPSAPALPTFLAQQVIPRGINGEAGASGKAPPPEPAPEEAVSAGEETPPAGNGEEASPLINPFLDLAGMNEQSESSKSRMHDTIVSLNDKGLSRAEIEAVTGEPRNIIEAVIDHHRKPRAAT